MTKNTFSTELAKIAIFAQNSFTRTHEVREKALALSRQIVRNSANAIRAAHRGEFNQAQVLADEVKELDIPNLTPLEAINRLYELQQKARELTDSP